MTGYTKLFGSIIASTIWREPDHVRLVWITMLAAADQHGVVEASVPGLADFARVTVDQCRDALRVLAAPDPDSRTSDHDGRRIEVIEGGFRLLNHAKYRGKLNEDDRREYQREWKAKRASRQKSTKVDSGRQQSTAVDSSRQKSTRSTQAEAEAEAEAEAQTQERVCVFKTEPLPTPMDAALLDGQVTERAGRFIERYEAAYATHRKGARYLVKPHRDYEAAVGLCRTWPDDRLDKLAAIFLTTDHEWAERGSRTIPQFAALASWCDSRLTEWEAKQGGRRGA